MEVVDVLSLPLGGHDVDNFDVHSVPYMDGSTQKWKQLILATGRKVQDQDGDKSHIAIVDVTDPYNPNKDYIRIRVRQPKDGDDLGALVPINQLAVYRDTRTPSSGTYNGDVFLIAHVGTFGTPLVVVPSTNPSTKARFIIINLSKTIALRQSGSSNDIVIHDAKTRDVTYGGMVTGNQNVYVGYIPTISNSTSMNVPHSVNYDQESGIMVLADVFPEVDQGTSYSYIDMFNLKDIAANCAANSSTLGVVNNLTMSDGKPVRIPLIDHPVTTTVTEEANALPHEVAPIRISDTKVRLVVSSSAREAAWSIQAGGVVVLDVDYSTPSASTITYDHYWPYDMDRDSPHKQYSDHTNTTRQWTARVVHSAFPFKHTTEDHAYVLTSDELVWTRYNRYDPELTISDGAWNDAPNIITIDGDIQDDRRYGAYVRIWETSLNSGEIHSLTGTGTFSGPRGMYDSRESTDPEPLYYSSQRSVPTTSVKTACSAVGDKSIGPNTVHRAIPVPAWNSSMFEVNANDVFVSAYSSGARVINLTNTHTNGVVLEKAFFDFIPTLNYNDASEYFYLMSGRDNQALGAYRHLPNLGMYFSGVYHTVPDFGTSRVGFNGTGTMLPDYKFVHAMAFGEGWIVDDPNVSPDHYAPDPQDVVNASGRNWLKDGGFIVLRYFDGKLGGTLSGYTGTNNWSDRSYRTINLQGPFSVDRDVTVAPGACVNLIPGHENDPGIFESTSLATSNGKVIYVDGILQISVESGDALGTDIVIDVPIIVRNNGKLIVHKIAPGKRVVFKRKVTIRPGGEWKFTPDADVELYHDLHDVHGKFFVAGEAGHRVNITSRRNGVAYSNSAYISGTAVSHPDSSLVAIYHADLTNVFFKFSKHRVHYTAPTLDNAVFTVTRNEPIVYRDMFHLDRPQGRFLFMGTVYSIPSHVYAVDSKFRDIYNPLGSWLHLGMHVHGGFKVTLESVTFDSLQRGFLGTQNRSHRIIGSSFRNCHFGAGITGGDATFCDNSFVNNKFASTIYGSGPCSYRDNDFMGMKFGTYVQSSGRQDYRNNTFKAYCRAIVSWGSFINLRDQAVGQGLWFAQFGRNDFVGQTDMYAPYGCMTADIGLDGRATLRVDCGYNEFSAYSQYHVTRTVGMPTIDATSNLWPNGGGYQPNLFQMAWTGVDLDEEADVDKSCANIPSVPLCVPPSGPNCPSPFLLEHSELTKSSPFIFNAIDTARTQAFDSGLGWFCRRNAAWSYYGLAMKADTITVFNRLKGDMASLAANTSLDSNLRSAAMYIHANVLSAEEKYDSSLIVHTALLTTLPTTVDSIPSNWEKLRLHAVIDTLGVQDSLLDVYFDRVLADLDRTDGKAGLAKSANNSVSNDRPQQDASVKVMFDGDAYPNPISGATDITVPISASAAATCVIEITTMQGSVVSKQDVRVSKDARHLVINVSDLAAGTYLARLSCFGSASTVQIVVHR